MEMIKASLATILGITAIQTETLIPLVVFVILAMVLDYLAGTLAGRKSTEGINSKEATKGLYKKAGFLCLLFLGFFLDVAIPYFAYAGLHLYIPFNTPFGVIMAAWIVITEAISIIENLSEIGVHVPKWLLKMLKTTKEKINDEKTK